MNHRLPPVMSGGVNGPSLNGLPGGPMMDVSLMHQGQHSLSNMISHSGHLHDRNMMFGGMPINGMGPSPHIGMPHLGPHMMNPHHGHQGLPMYGRPVNPYMNSPDNRINEFNRRLQQRNDECDNIWWDSFITDFFEDDATLTITFTDEGPRRYSVGRTLIPRYFRSIFESGCTEYHYFLRSVRESFHSSTIVVDCECAQMVMAFPRTMPPTTITVEGRLVLDFTFDEFMRIRNWNFQIRNHREFVLRSIPGLGYNQDMQQMRELFSVNLTKSGIPNNTMSFFRICNILEPMQELMSRQKAYSLSPKDCLKTTLFQKWQRMVAPPGQQQKSESSRQTNKRRKRKGSSANSDTASGRSSKRKHSPVPSIPNLNQPGDVMIVGEPTLMGGEFGDEDERSITRLENTQYDNIGSILTHGQQSHIPNMSGPHLGLNQLNNSYQNMEQITNFGNNQSSEPKSADSPSSNINGSLNNLLKSDSRLIYPGTCTTPSNKINGSSGQDQQIDDVTFRKTGPTRPTSQGANQVSVGDL